jgi:hypothetical protein
MPHPAVLIPLVSYRRRVPLKLRPLHSIEFEEPMNSFTRLSPSTALLPALILIALLPGCGDADAYAHPKIAESPSEPDTKAAADAEIPKQKRLTAGRMMQDFLGYPTIQ